MITKIAEEIKEKMVRPNILRANVGLRKARRASDKGFGHYVTDPKLVTDSTVQAITQAVQEGAIGAGAGGLAALLTKTNPKAGMVLGGSLGTIAGSVAGATKADREYLKRKGIRPRLGGLSAEFTPEAAKKYL
jgi:hypothetical protein